MLLGISPCTNLLKNHPSLGVVSVNQHPLGAFDRTDIAPHHLVVSEGLSLAVLAVSAIAAASTNSEPYSLMWSRRPFTSLERIGHMAIQEQANHQVGIQDKTRQKKRPLRIKNRKTDTL